MNLHLDKEAFNELIIIDEKRRDSMSVRLVPVKREDVETVWRMQVEAFSDMLEKYQDYELSPATEDVDRVIARFEQPETTYFFIVADDKKVGAIRVVDKQDESRKRISPIFIMKEFRNKGYAQQAILEVERLFGSDNWSLDTILQEKGNIHLYEKLGFSVCGKRPNYYGNRETAILMKKEIKEKSDEDTCN